MFILTFEYVYNISADTLMFIRASDSECAIASKQRPFQFKAEYRHAALKSDALRIFSVRMRNSDYSAIFFTQAVTNI